MAVTQHYCIVLYAKTAVSNFLYFYSYTAYFKPKYSKLIIFNILLFKNSVPIKVGTRITVNYLATKLNH